MPEYHFIPLALCSRRDTASWLTLKADNQRGIRTDTPASLGEQQNRRARGRHPAQYANGVYPIQGRDRPFSACLQRR